MYIHFKKYFCDFNKINLVNIYLKGVDKMLAFIYFINDLWSH